MKITENIHVLKHTFFVPVNPTQKLERFVCSFIILGKNNVYLVDSGVSDSENNILNYIVENGYSVKDIRTLVLTHSHPDHIGSAKSIKDKSNCKVFAHSAEREWIENIDKQSADRPVPGFSNFVKDSVKIDRFLKDNEEIELEDGLIMKVIHTPGHSCGSISLFVKNENTLLCGDSLLLPGSLPIYDNALQAVLSILKLKKLESVNTLLSSWSEPVTGEGVILEMDKSIGYFKALHKTITGIPNANNLQPMDLCKQVIEKMGLPSVAINPLVAKSFQSNINNEDNSVLI